ncbi:MAG: hypothetical protein E7443_02735 [Ruminococcaceae bacterium]|nr:hypothetical protein [Oscillospiraceae bacterium]
MKQRRSGGIAAEKRADTVRFWLFGGLLFLSATVMTGWMSVFLAAAACVTLFLLGKRGAENFREHLCIPVIGLLLFALANGAAAIYSPFDETAVAEFYKIFAAIALFAVAITRFEKKHVRGLLWGMAGVCAAISLLSIDLACDGILFEIFRSVTEILGGSYTGMEDAGGRVGGLYNNANVFAGLVSVGAVSALYLADSEEERGKKLPAWLLVGLCAQGLLLSASRGGLLCFGLALLVWLIAAEKTARLRLFLKMLLAAVAAGAASAVAAAAVRGGTAWLALMVTVLSGAAMWGLDRFLAGRLTGLLSGRGKLVAATLAVIFLLCAGYVIAAVAVKGPYTFTESGHLRREIVLEAGDYTVSGDWDGEVYVWVSTENREQLFLDIGDVAYDGLLENAAFTVPEGTRQVTFGISAQPGTVLRELVLSDGTKIPLDYPLIPGFLEDRLQGNLFLSSSFLLRVQFMKDALTLFAQKPLLGHGLSSTENLYAAVQPFRYESRYVHNHILQFMSDMGLFGLLSYLLLAGGAAWLLIRKLRQEREMQTAMLLGGWVMINAHSLMEINFSVRSYQCVAMVFFAVIVIACGHPLIQAASVRGRIAAKRAGIAVQALLCLYLAVFGGLLMSHRTVNEEAAVFSGSSVQEYMDAWRSYIRRDVFTTAQHKLNFVGNAVRADGDQYREEMERWAGDLRRSGTYTNCSGLARHYYLPKGAYEEMFACSREGIAQVASSPDGWNLQMNFYRSEVLPVIEPEELDVYLDGVLALETYLEAYNAERMEEISLTEENEAFLSVAKKLRENPIDAGTAYMVLSAAAG